MGRQASTSIWQTQRRIAQGTIARILWSNQETNNWNRRLQPHNSSSDISRNWRGIATFGIHVKKNDKRRTGLYHNQEEDVGNNPGS